MLARGRYKYHHYVNYAPELFDLYEDPEETSDLAGNPRYKPVLDEFQAELYRLLDPAQVDRRAKDDQNSLITRYGGREAALELGNRGATPVPKKFIYA